MEWKFTKEAAYKLMSEFTHICPICGVSDWYHTYMCNPCFDHFCKRKCRKCGKEFKLPYISIEYNREILTYIACRGLCQKCYEMKYAPPWEFER